MIACMMNNEKDDWMMRIGRDGRDETVEDDEQKEYEVVDPFEEELVRSFAMLSDLVERGIEPSLREFSEINFT